ncbi:MAG: translocation/assembly module TamB domain-containing protein [Gallionella sp.]|nr:translocation/assembly module TamB domain-containing protein [Gallionella sp.]
MNVLLRQPRFQHWPKLVLLVTVIVMTSCTWLLTSNTGLQWLVAAVAQGLPVKLEYQGLQGRLIGPLQLQSLKVQSGETHIALQDVQLNWHLVDLLQGRLTVSKLSAAKLSITAPSSNTATPLPQDLSLPIKLAVSGLHLGELNLIKAGSNAPYFSAREIDAILSSDGARYEVHQLQVRSDFGQLSASGVMQSTRPFQLQAQADLSGIDELASFDDQAHIIAVANGDLSSLDIAARGEGAALDGTAQAHIAPFSLVPLQSLNVQLSGLDPHAFAPAAPKAKLKLLAELKGSATELLAGKVQLHNDTPATVDQGGLPVLDASTQLHVTADALRCEALLIKLPGAATISGNLGWKLGKGLADLRVTGLDPSALDSRLRSAHLSGALKLSGNENAQQASINLSDTTLQLSGDLQISGNKLTLQQLRLASAQAELSGSGELQLDGLQSYSLNGRLHHFDIAAFLPHAPHSELNATVTLSGALQPQASGTLDLTMDNSHIAQQAVQGKGHIVYNDKGQGTGDVLFKIGDNQLNLKGGYGKAGDILYLDLLAPALSQLGTGYGGALQFHASFAGNLSKPDATLQADLQQLSLPNSYHWENLSATASLHDEAVELHLQAGELSDSARILLQSAQLDVHGAVHEHELQLQAKLAGDDKLMLHAKGDWQTPALWQGALTALETSGRLNARLLHDTPLNITRTHIDMGAADFSLAGGSLSIDTLDWTPKLWRSSGKFSDIGLRMGKLADGTAPDLTALRLGGAWNVQAGAQLTGDIDIHRERGDLVLPSSPPTALGLDILRFNAHAVPGKLSAELVASGTRLGELQAQFNTTQTPRNGRWQIPENAALSGHMHVAATDLSWIGPVVDSELKTGGHFTLDADLAGTLGAPRLLGKLQGEELSFAWLDQGVRLEQGRLNASFDRQTLHLEELVFMAPHDAPPDDTLLTGVPINSGAGALHATGNIDLNGTDSDLEISAFQVPLTQRKDRWIIVSGSGHARLKDEALSLSGNITTDAGLIRPVGGNRPQLSEDIVLVGRPNPKRQNMNISVDATLDLGEHFYLRASGLEARLVGKLSAQQSPGQALRVTGAISTRDASFDAYGQSLTVERGIVNFNGPIYDPGLNILALRKGLTVEAGVTVTGTALHPVVKLVSTPTVPDTEKLSWIVLGRAPDTTGTDLSLLLAAAEGVMGSGSSGGVTGQLKRTMGIDQLTVKTSTSTTGATTQSTTANDPLSNQIAVVGKRLSGRAYLSYEQGVTAAVGVTKLTYKLSQRVNIITQAGFENAIDVTYSFRFE